MKRISILIAAALVAALSVFALVGCGGESSDSEPTPEATEQTQEEIVAELQDAVANATAFQSVTVNDETTAGAVGEEESSTSTGLYKFDESGESPKTYFKATIDDISLEYYSDGENAVLVTDGPVYGGTTEQFGDPHFGGFQAYLADRIGDLNTIIECASDVTKEQQDDTTVYTVTIDPEKLIAADEDLQTVAEVGNALTAGVYTIAFDQDGHIVSIVESLESEMTASEVALTLSDFDSTTIDSMPEATSTYDEMLQDEDLKYGAFAEQLGASADDEAAK